MQEVLTLWPSLGPQATLDPLVPLALQVYQVPLALQVTLASLVLKVREATRERQESQ